MLASPLGFRLRPIPRIGWAETGNKFLHFRSEGPIRSAQREGLAAGRLSAEAFTPDGRRLVIGSWDHTLQLGRAGGAAVGSRFRNQCSCQVADYPFDRLPTFAVILFRDL